MERRGESSEESGTEDSEYDYTGEESNHASEETEEEDVEEEWQPGAGAGVREDGAGEDWQYCERAGRGRGPVEAPQVYPPDRGPPLLDFIFVLTAFAAATFAALYTILSETGAPPHQ